MVAIPGHHGRRPPTLGLTTGKVAPKLRSAALAEFIRELIVDGTRDQRLGRPPAMTAEQIRKARDLLTRPDNTVSSIARLLGVSRATIYKHVPEATGRVVAALPPGQE